MKPKSVWSPLFEIPVTLKSFLRTQRHAEVLYVRVYPFVSPFCLVYMRRTLDLLFFLLFVQELWLSFWSEVHYNSLYQAGGKQFFCIFVLFPFKINVFSLIFCPKFSRGSYKKTEEEALDLLKFIVLKKYLFSAYLYVLMYICN